MSESVEQNLQAQRELYGEVLGDTFRRLLTAFSLNQAQLAGLLGLSAPMLSQLMSGHRVKIGNPVVLERVRALDALRGEELDHEELGRRLDPVRATATQVTGPRHDDGDAARVLHDLLREVASGRELREAADLLEPQHPGLAEVLRRYGLGDLDDARAHLARTLRR